MNEKKLLCIPLILCILLSMTLGATAIKTFEDEENDVLYYERNSYERDDENTPIHDPKVDIVSLSCEVSTVGTTILLTIADDFATDFDEFYSYVIHVYPNASVNDYYNIVWRVDQQEEEWDEFVNAANTDFSVNGSTLSVFFEGLVLDESTVDIKAEAVNGTVNTGYSQDWYPDGEEKETDSNTTNNESNNNQTTDNPSNDTPGFEWMTIILGLVLMIFIFRRK